MRWSRRSIRRNGPFALLDIAGGTGDVAFRVIEARRRGNRATVCDINADMLEVGRERAAARALGDAVTFAEANAEALPFADRSFDAATIAFGIRNVPRIERALAEAYRVLKIGGRFLASNSPPSTFPASTGSTIFIRSTSFRRSAAWSPATPNPIAISWNRSAAFRRRKTFAAMMRAAGFARVSFQTMSGGIVALHSGWRL